MGVRKGYQKRYKNSPLQTDTWNKYAEKWYKELGKKTVKRGGKEKEVKYQKYLDMWETKGMRAFQGLDIDELKEIYSSIKDIVNKRYDNIVKLFPIEGTTPSIKAINERGGKLSMKGLLKTENDYLEQINSGLEFLNNPTSTVEGQRKYYKEFGFDDLSYEKSSQMWEGYRKFVEENRVEAGYESSEVVKYMVSEVISDKRRAIRNKNGQAFLSKSLREEMKSVQNAAKTTQSNVAAARRRAEAEVSKPEVEDSPFFT